MATYLMFGKYSPEAAKAISRDGTGKATDFIKQNGSEIKSAYAVLGDTDLVLAVELPDNARAMKVGVGLSKMLGVSSSTAPAITIDEFDSSSARTVRGACRS